VFRAQPSDLAILVIFGAIGYICKKLHFDVTPMAMGFILGPTLEYSYGQSVILAQDQLLHFLFIDRPITATILLLTPVATFLMWRRSKRLQAQFNTED
jgi:putative tricarboxylic transport membrane protein